MCGIAGIIQNYNKLDLNKEIISITDVLSHRGPDNMGHWVSKSNNIALGHTRLSIIDLSKNGNQPMHSKNQRYVISFNGEIYNYRELKKKLMTKANILWKSTTDTEVILQLLEFYTFEETLKLLKGMFAISIWDNKENCLYLARDRAGEKPLYYFANENFFIFASELKSIKKSLFFNDEINKESVFDLINHGYISAPNSIFKNTKKLEPGNYLVFNQKKMDYKINRYWNINYQSNLKKQIGKRSIEDNIENILLKSLEKQLHADVPVGIFLSGGIDSSLIVSLTTKLGIRPKTFTIGFDDNDFDESKDSKKIAEYLNTEHHEHYLTSKEALNLIPKMQNIYCEPFGDSSQIPTYLISKIARQNVTVALSGDGGDELFGGYNRHIYANRFFSCSKFIPNNLRKLISSYLEKSNISKSKQFYNLISKVIPKKYVLNNFSDKIIKIAKVIDVNGIDEFYEKITSNIILYGNIMKNQNIKFNQFSKLETDLNIILDKDFNKYLPDDILCKVDRASMANSLEIRAPFLEQELIEYAFNLKFKEKVDFSNGKIPLRNILSKLLPQKLISKNKRGFGIPLNNWLREELRDWSEDLISRKNINEYDFFNYEAVHKLWKEHINGTRENQNILWPLLMFQSWLLYKH